MKVSALYDHNVLTGYGRMSHEIVAALRRKGVEVVDYKEDDKSPYVLFMCPPHRPEGWWKGQHTTLLTMWESTELAMEHLTVVPLFDQVLVPSQQNLEMFGRVNPHTSLFNLGCNYDEWNYVPRTYSDPFTIITGGKGGRRKGIDITIKVFKRFRHRQKSLGFPAPRLVIKADVTLSQNDPDIIIVTDRMSADEEADLYASAHVCFALSRGEGWGMIPHQTIAQGTPTVLSEAHGHVGFSHYGFGVSCGFTPAETEIVGRSGDWWEPSEDEAYEWLCQIHDHYDDYLSIAATNADEIKDDLTWDKAAQTIIDSLPRPKRVTDQWVTCPQTYLTLRVTQPFACNIGPKDYHFLPGQEYAVTADVKRVIYDAGYMDLTCLDPYEKALYEGTNRRHLDGISAENIDEGVLV